MGNHKGTVLTGENKMRLLPWRKRESKFKILLHRLEDIHGTIKALRDSIEDYENDVEDQKNEHNEKQKEENIAIVALQSEIRALREELNKKNQFIEGLLSKLFDGVNIKSLMTPAEVSTPKSQLANYIARKNGESTHKPKLP